MLSNIATGLKAEGKAFDGRSEKKNVGKETSSSARLQSTLVE